MSLRHGLAEAGIPRAQSIPLTSPHMAYARYIVPVPVAEGSDGHAKRGQVLERAWRELNSRLTVETGDADVDADADADAEGNAKEREVWAVLRVEAGAPALWAFGMRDEALPDLEGLESRAKGSLGKDVQLMPVTEKGSLDCRKLVLCSTHGNDLDCLSTDKNRGCDVKWTPGDIGRYWDRLAMAMMEGLAWRAGKRVYADRFECHLWPLSNERLALFVQNRPEGEESTINVGRSCVLEPLGARAIPLGDYYPTPAQRIDLVAGISASLGAGTFDPRVMDLDSDLELGQAQWGVFWVSTKPDLSADEEIRRHPGRLAIWPKALCSSVTPLPGGRDDAPHPPLPLPLSASTDSSPDSLMQVATGLFDFFNTYVPPSEVDIAEITPETEGPDLLDSSPCGESAPFGPSPTSPRSRRASDAASDLDDLFSAGSPSPPTATKALESIEAADQPTKADDTVEPGSLAGGAEPATRVDLENPDMSMDIDENMYAQMKEWEDLTGMGGMDGVGGAGGGGAQTGDDAPGVSITEDDFNFFDSPPPPGAAPLQEESDRVDSLIDDAKIGEQTVSTLPAAFDLTADVEGTPGRDADVSQTATASTVLSATAEGTASAPIEIDEEVIPEPSPQQATATSASDLGTLETEAVTNPQPSTSPDVGFPARRKTVTFEVERSPPQPELEDAELVPMGYEPLEIDPALTSFKYSLPSPAASPETDAPHRVELIKRMRAAAEKQGKKDDYASEWDIESEQSEEEDSEDFSGAPPTPVSMIDTEPLDSLATTPRKEVGSKEGAEGLRWEGIDVLGPDEVVEIRWDGRDGSGMGWKDAWNRFAGEEAGADVGNAGRQRIPDGVDIGTLFDTLLTNRHMRDLLLDVASEKSLGRKTGLGAALGDAPKPLSACNIHVGLQDTVCQIAMSALLYSRQLGVQPLGGEKDVNALVMAESDDCRAKSFLSDMGRIYETYNFGVHRTAKHSLAKEGIISLPAAGFADALTALVPNLPPHAVVYVVLPISEPAALAKLISKLLSQLATPENIVLKVVPAHALDSDSLLDIALEVYDKITRPLEPISVRGSPIDLPVASLQYPAFTLAPLHELKVDLSLSWPLRSYDVLNRWRLIHCAYGWNEARDRVVGFVLDSAGEGWSQFQLSVEADKADDALENLHRFFADFAKRASTEYRLTICAVGAISKIEIDYWTKTGPSSKTPLTLIVAESPSATGSSTIRTPATVVPISGAIFADSTTRLIDETLAGAVTELPRLPVRLAVSSEYIIPTTSIAVSIGLPEWASTSVYYILSHRCPPDRADGANEVVSNEFYRLTCLARTRFGMGKGEAEVDGPVHVAYVRMCLRALELVEGK